MPLCGNGCGASPELVFFNGRVITCGAGGEDIRNSAVAVTSGRISAVGSDKEVKDLANKATRMINLKGNTLSPGFIDAHSHFANAIMVADWVNVSIPPIAGVKCLDDMKVLLREKAKTTKPGDFVVAYGYDESVMGFAKGKGLSFKHLDDAVDANPCVVIHNSNHGIMLNSVAMKYFGIDSNYTPPKGGSAVKNKKGQYTGELWEMAIFPVWFRMMKENVTQDYLSKYLDQAMDHYLSNGYTTVNEGFTSDENVAFLQKMAQENRLKVDVISLPAFTHYEQFLNDLTFGKYHNNLKFGGIKIVGDGSPQGGSAFLSEGYLDGHNGDLNVPQEKINDICKQCRAKGVQVLCHANGDGTIDAFIEAMSQDELPDGNDERHVVIHSQIVRKEQLEYYEKKNIIPSFFTNHCFYFGDIHLQKLGDKRANYISPMKTAMDMGITCTNHSDYTVTPLNPLFLLWTSVVRKTRTGVVLGKEHCLTPLEALKAMTINVAKQWGEEDNKGSIEVGKVADLIVLSKDITRCDYDKIKDVKIQMTFKNGVELFNRKMLVQNTV